VACVRSLSMSDLARTMRHARYVGKRRACRQGQQGAVLMSLCMVRLGSGRFGVGFWAGLHINICSRARVYKSLLAASSPHPHATIPRAPLGPKIKRKRPSLPFHACFHEPDSSSKLSAIMLLRRRDTFGLDLG